MINKKTVDQELSTLRTLRSLTRVYGEIASTRMKQTRESVVSGRKYLEDIYKVFDDVRLSYAKKIHRIARRRKKSGITFLAHNGKSVAVLLSSDTGLYGEIIPSTFKLFIRDVKSSSCEVTIVGRQGLGLFLSSGKPRLYTFFEYPDRGNETEDLSKIISHIVSYDEIRLYYGKFQSVITQKPVQHIISSEIDITGEKTNTKRTEYIFEPDLESILGFFETEIFATVFDQAFREAELAKYASRILAMDAAYQNIRNETQRLSLLGKRIEHRMTNRKQLNSMPSLMKSQGLI